MNAAYRPIRLALAIAPALLGLTLAWAPAARACDMKAVDDELAREAAAQPAQPQLHAAADPSPNNDPSPSDDNSAKSSSAETPSPPANGSANSGSQSTASQNTGKSASPMRSTETPPESKQ